LEVGLRSQRKLRKGGSDGSATRDCVSLTHHEEGRCPLAFLRAVLRTVRDNLWLHLFVPLVATIVVWLVSEGAKAAFEPRPSGWFAPLARFFQHNPSLWHLLLEITSVYLAYFIVIIVSVWKSSEVGSAEVGALNDSLLKATRLIGIGTIGLREWFEPNSLLYLGTVIKHQIDCQRSNVEFKHQRVLLFHDSYELQKVQASYLDEEYAKTFNAIHNTFGIPLAFLGPDDLASILADGSASIPKDLRYRRWFGGSHRIRPFAVIEKNSGSLVIIYAKQGRRLKVRPCHDQKVVAGARKLVDKITNTVFDETGMPKKQFDFNKLIGYV
jgi:hypothetical protein